jgi:hypothetical protein
VSEASSQHVGGWLWRLGAGLAAFLLVFGGGILIWLTRDNVRSSEPYQLALERVRNSSVVRDILGGPIEETGWLSRRKLQIDDTAGKAEIEFEVDSPKGGAIVQGTARRLDGKWEFTYLEVRGRSVFSKIVLTPLLPKAPEPN